MLDSKLAALLAEPGQTIAIPEDELDARDLWLLWQAARAHMKHIDEMCQAALLEFNEDHGGFDVGEVRVTNKVQKREKLREMGPALLELLTRLDYDPDEIAKVLSANALKPGACAAVIGQDFRDNHFKTELVQKLDDGKAKKVLVAIPHAYLAPGQLVRLPRKEEK